MSKHLAAVAALGIFAFTNSAVQAAPVRPKASAATTAKRKVAAARAAEERAAQRAAAEAAERAAAEAARGRAQWGLLFDIGEADFQTADGLPVTVRRSGEVVEVTVWNSFARGAVRFERDAATGTMTLSTPGQWSRKTYPAQVLADGSIEAKMKNESRWTAFARDPDGGFLMAGIPGGKLKFASVVPGGKAAVKLEKLVGEGKVASANAAVSPATVGADGLQLAQTVRASAVVGIQSMAAIQASEGVEFFRKLKGDWSNDSRLWSFAPASDHVTFDQWGIDGKQIRSGTIERKGEKLLFGGTLAEPIANGIYFRSNEYALVMKNDEEFIVTAGKLKNGAFLAKNGQALPYLGTYRRLSSEQASKWRSQAEGNRLAEVRRKQQSKGNSGMLGGLLAGFGAAMAGGNAEMVMGAAMKGVEMTTDNEMSRNVVAGQGDAMIGAGFERRAAENRPATSSNAATSASSASADGASARGGSPGNTGSAQAAPSANAASVLQPPSATGGKRPGYYACNSYNVTTKVSYYSPIIVRPYDERWERRLEASFASHTGRFFPGEYHGGGASCWARTSQADSTHSIADSKQFSAQQGQSQRNVIDWAPPE